MSTDQEKKDGGTATNKSGNSGKGHDYTGNLWVVHEDLTEVKEALGDNFDAVMEQLNALMTANKDGKAKIGAVENGKAQKIVAKSIKTKSSTDEAKKAKKNAAEAAVNVIFIGVDRGRLTTTEDNVQNDRKVILSELERIEALEARVTVNEEDIENLTNVTNTLGEDMDATNSRLDLVETEGKKNHEGIVALREQMEGIGDSLREYTDESVLLVAGEVKTLSKRVDDLEEKQTTGFARANANFRAIGAQTSTGMAEVVSLFAGGALGGYIGRESGQGWLGVAVGVAIVLAIWYVIKAVQGGPELNYSGNASASAGTSPATVEVPPNVAPVTNQNPAPAGDAGSDGVSQLNQRRAEAIASVNQQHDAAIAQVEATVAASGR